MSQVAFNKDEDVPFKGSTRSKRPFFVLAFVPFFILYPFWVAVARCTDIFLAMHKYWMQTFDIRSDSTR